MRVAIAGVMLAALAFLTGCPPVKQPPIPLPPAITLDEQLKQLNDRASALENLKGHGKVTVSYFDAQGKKHTHDADGTLQLRQHLEDVVNPADMLLLGRVVGQDAFEAGMNRTNYWMAVRVDPKQAMVGSVANMGNVPVGAMPLRADRVVELVAITPLHDSAAQHISMVVNDQNGTNEIHVTKMLFDGLSYVERAMVVDRRTGNIDQVRLYNPDGTMLAKADMSKYRTIEYKPNEDVPTGPGPQSFPMRIAIEYPQRNNAARVLLEFGDMAMVPSIPDKRFALPDFEQQGLKVVDLDEPEQK